jgi:hypothetical protein
MEVPKECKPTSSPVISAKPRRSTRTHRSRRTTPVTKATSGRGSSWDEPDSEIEVEVVETIHRSDDPYFNVADQHVVRSEAMEKALDNFEEACDEDTPLNFRPLMAEFIMMGKLRQSLSDSMECEYVLTDDDGSTPRHPELSQWRRDVTFPVKRRRITSRPSDSPEF